MAIAGGKLGMYPHGNEILVVVHDFERRELIARLLSAEGFAVAAAGDGLTALRACANWRFGVIVAATDMPGSIDGFAIVRRARHRQPWLKALYTGEPATRVALAHTDMADFIAAPFERAELVGCVFELLHRSAGSEAADLCRRVRAEVRVS